MPTFDLLDLLGLELEELGLKLGPASSHEFLSSLASFLLPESPNNVLGPAMEILERPTTSAPLPPELEESSIHRAFK
ncbi:hypothetical protein Taro_045032 [Colocasia esculenta]|uniref:Uncharacterized protein n=1 Tax=Colocasia esculenta TaxID=4460 RepID=A0A843WZF0_COLES|nr:hypothetical protein [Colocasia esculenta]